MCCVRMRIGNHNQPAIQFLFGNNNKWRCAGNGFKEYYLQGPYVNTDFFSSAGFITVDGESFPQQEMESRTQ